MKYDKTLLDSGKLHGTQPGIGVDVHTTAPITGKDICTLNRRYMGAGMSQNYVAIYFFEYFYEANRFEYIVEFGSQKGALSTYFANLAGITEQFFFETYEIDQFRDWHSRANEGAGHWFDRLAEISPYIYSYGQDIFCAETYDHVSENVKNLKTFIFCDGGDKIREFNMYAPLMKPGDRIAVHDWPDEVQYEDLKQVCEKYNLEVDAKWALDSEMFGTLIMPFKVKD